MEKKRYILTDGHETFDAQLMTAEDVDDANARAAASTDNNIYWTEVLDKESETYNDIQAGDTVWMSDIGDYGKCLEVLDYRHITVKSRDGETEVIDVRKTGTSRT
jgi:hypothetical protein